MITLLYLSAVPAAAGTVHAEASGPRALCDVVFSMAQANGWLVAFEDAPIHAPSELVDFRDEKGAFVAQVVRTYTDAIDYDPVAGPLSALTAVVEAHNRAGNPGVFEVRVFDGVTDVIGIGALDASGKYVVATPLLDTTVTLALKARTIDEGINDVLLQVGAATKQTLELGPVLQMGLRADTSVSSAGSPARVVIHQMLEEGRASYTWALLQGANTDGWGFNVRMLEPPASPTDPKQ